MRAAVDSRCRSLADPLASGPGEGIGGDMSAPARNDMRDELSHWCFDAIDFLWLQAVFKATEATCLYDGYAVRFG